MRRMWPGLEIVVVGLPPLSEENQKGRKMGGKYLFPIFDNKLINGNKIEAYMQKNQQDCSKNEDVNSYTYFLIYKRGERGK